MFISVHYDVYYNIQIFILRQVAEKGLQGEQPGCILGSFLF